MEIREIYSHGLVTFVEVDNVTVGGEPVIAFVESETGYAPYDAYPLTATRWLTVSDRHTTEV